jgi:hypothetical protein
MAQFFLPTQPNPAHVTVAAEGAELSSLLIRPGAPARVGLWGFGFNWEPLEVRVFRGGTWVSGSPSSAVKLTRTMNVPSDYSQVFTITGLRQGDTLLGVMANGQAFTNPLPVYELNGTPSGIMQEAASLYGVDLPRHHGISFYAIPYLALRDAKMGGMATLRDATAGGPLMNVHGLAVHTTAGTDARSAYLMARWGCVETWNQKGVSAHFGVAGDGTLVQFLPVTHIAYAQYSPGNEHWISVEVDNNGKSPMNALQLASVKRLFRWVCNRFGTPRQLATGCLFPKSPAFDKVTAEVCARAKAETTTDPYEACMSRGVSCHWWLEANKTSNSHACPGPGILDQLDEVAQG